MKFKSLIIGCLSLLVGLLTITYVVANEETVYKVKTSSELINAVNESNENLGNVTIVLAKGTYEIRSLLHIYQDNITIISESDNYEDVTIKGSGMYGNVSHIFLVSASDFTVEGISLGEVKNHVIQVQGEKGASNVTVKNCRLFNSYEQLLKVSGKGEIGLSSTNGLVENCLFEYTKGVGPQYYIGGIDAHYSKGWIVRGNTFKNIISPETALAEHAIHFWSESEDTLVENNIIVECDRGIGFGLGSSTHKGGIIRGNSVYTTRDVGIGLENALNVQVYNNYLYTLDYANSIEYRFAGTVANIHDNITTGTITKRDGGEGTLANNLILETNKWFISIEGKAIPNVTSENPSIWAVASIDYLKTETSIKDDLYHLYGDHISRKDFAYLAVALYEDITGTSSPNINSEDLSVFTDTKDEYVLKAYKVGIIKGYGNKLFGPNDLVTREQVAVMLIKALNEGGMYLTDDSISDLTFKDQEQMSAWALNSIKIAYKHGIMNGVGEGVIQPKGNATREQALVLIYNILFQKNDFDLMEKPSYDENSIDNSIFKQEPLILETSLR